MLIQTHTRHSAYREFARRQRDMPIFAKDWYLDAVYGDDWDVVMVERGNEIVASLPFCIKKKAFFKYVGLHPFIQSLGPYIHPDFRNPNQETRLLRELIGGLPKMDSFEQCLSHQVTNWLPFKWEGFQQTTLYTYLIEDITDTDKVWEDFHSNFRNRIKKAQTEVEVVTDRSLEDFYQVAQMTYARQGLKMPYDYDSLHQFDSRLYMECRSRIFFAQDKEGCIHSVLYMTLGDQYAHFHLAGEDPALRSSGAGMLLIWEAIQYASREEKLQGFDFQGSVIPSIEKVRRKSGAVQKPYFRVWKHSSSLFKMVKSIKG